MQTVEISAKSVDEATKAAAEKLGVSTDQVVVTVLEETKGLFGRSSVRVRAEVKAVEEPKPAKPARAPRAAKAEPEPAPVPEVAPAVEEAPVVVESKKIGARSRKIGASRPAAPKAPVEAPAPAAAPKAVQAEVKPAEPEVVEEVEREPVVATQADAEQLVGLVAELMAAAQLQVNVRVGEVAGRYVNVVLDGKDAAFLVGKHGEVLNAMQYLVNIIAGRKFNNGVRATLDCNDYRRRREEALTGLATKIATEVKARGEEAVLDALPAFERRVVHKALSEIQGVTTYSEGEEPNRRVVIAPA